ncbi:hypothetical protein NMY22_g13737 [Coprinellus aureogranulatus]|nr:hypothetical protein NMY22_g13737 [Coprinellus aureogranulatus]
MKYTGVLVCAFAGIFLPRALATDVTLFQLDEHPSTTEGIVREGLSLTITPVSVETSGETVYVAVEAQSKAFYTNRFQTVTIVPSPTTHTYTFEADSTHYHFAVETIVNGAQGHSDEDCTIGGDRSMVCQVMVVVGNSLTTLSIPATSTGLAKPWYTISNVENLALPTPSNAALSAVHGTGTWMAMLLPTMGLFTGALLLITEKARSRSRLHHDSTRFTTKGTQAIKHWVKGRSPDVSSSLSPLPVMKYTKAVVGAFAGVFLHGALAADVTLYQLDEAPATTEGIVRSVTRYPSHQWLLSRVARQFRTVTLVPSPTTATYTFEAGATHYHLALETSVDGASGTRDDDCTFGGDGSMICQVEVVVGNSQTTLSIAATSTGLAKPWYTISNVENLALPTTSSSAISAVHDTGMSRMAMFLLPAMGLLTGVLLL